MELLRRYVFKKSKYALKRENAKYEPGNPIRNTKAGKISFGLFGIIFGGVSIGELVNPSIIQSADPPLPAVFFGVFAWMNISVFIYDLNLSITFKSHGLIYRNCVRRTHEIPYSDITRYGLERFRGEPVFVIYMADKKYRFRSDLVGFAYLREQVRENVGEDKAKNLTYIEPS